jgi:hypothetical protein
MLQNMRFGSRASVASQKCVSRGEDASFLVGFQTVHTADNQEEPRVFLQLGLVLLAVLWSKRACTARTARKRFEPEDFMGPDWQR